jgi:predicted DNA-binding protein
MSRRIAIYMKKEERQMLKFYASQLGMSISEFIRFLIKEFSAEDLKYFETRYKPDIEFLVTVDERILKKLDEMEKKLKRPRSTIVRAMILTLEK